MEVRTARRRALPCRDIPLTYDDGKDPAAAVLGMDKRGHEPARYAHMSRLLRWPAAHDGLSGWMVALRRSSELYTQMVLLACFLYIHAT